MRISPLVLAAALVVTTSGQTPEFDVLIRNGQVLDGTGAAAVRADVGLRGDRIVAVGQLANRAARRSIDANGLMVAPGFIDLHTHSETPLLADGTAQSKIRQGVTLDITGEGSSPAPRDGLAASAAEGITPDWTTFTEPVRLGGTAASVPRGFIACTAPPTAATFRPLAERIRADASWRYDELPTGHDAMATTPHELARLLLDVATS